MVMNNSVPVFVMAGLVPAIHVFQTLQSVEGVDARHKSLPRT